MKNLKNIIKVFAIFSIAILALSSPAEAAATVSNSGNQKILIAYFSRTGNTETLAGYIRDFTGGNLFKITTATPYPSDYSKCTAQASDELERDFRPKLSSRVKDMAQYSTVYIGYPIWWGDAPMAIRSFLEAYDLKGKTIIPFCTSGSSGIGESVSSIRKLSPGATVLDAFHVRGGAVGNAKSDVKSWIESIRQ